MANYGYSYLLPEAVSVTPEKFLELRLFFPDIQVLKIIPPTPEKNDFGRILILASSIKDGYTANFGKL